MTPINRPPRIYRSPTFSNDQASCACPGLILSGTRPSAIPGRKRGNNDTIPQKSRDEEFRPPAEKPFPDVMAFDAVVRSLILNNPLGCTSYRSVKKHHPPVEKVREMYTAKLSSTS
jgi:hypothetical protein